MKNADGAILTKPANLPKLVAALVRQLAERSNAPVPLCGGTKTRSAFFDGASIAVRALAVAARSEGLLVDAPGGSADGDPWVTVDEALARAFLGQAGAVVDEAIGGALAAIDPPLRALADQLAELLDRRARLVALRASPVDRLESAVQQLLDRIDAELAEVKAAARSQTRGLSAIRERLIEAELVRASEMPDVDVEGPSEVLLEVLQQLEHAHPTLGGSLALPMVRDAAGMPRDAFDRAMLGLQAEGRVVLEVPSDAPRLKRRDDGIRRGELLYYYVFRRDA